MSRAGDPSFFEPIFFIRFSPAHPLGHSLFYTFPVRHRNPLGSRLDCSRLRGSGREGVRELGESGRVARTKPRLGGQEPAHNLAGRVRLTL